jgi:low affinity Fe/Cu permease
MTRHKSLSSSFSKIARKVANASGSPIASLIAFLIIIIWAITGPIFGFSDTWQLVINTGTTIVTFLMVFLIQNSQNRDAKAVQIKLDELIRAIADARNELIDTENDSEEELQKIQADFSNLVHDSLKDESETLLDTQ